MEKSRFKSLSYIICILLIFTLTPQKLQAQAVNVVSVTYQGQVQRIGWQNWVSDGQEAGTEGKGLRVEALKIKLVNAPAGASIKYQAHVQSIGWQNWVSNGQEAGTDGKSLRVEAIKITLENMPGYSIQYQAHVQSIGWQNWVSDGQQAGTDGKSLRVEAIRIRIVKNNSTATFDSQGGSTVSNEIPSSNNKIIPPVVPKKAGYTFIGWYKEAGCLNVWNFATDTVTSDITLYAKWTSINSLVTYQGQVQSIGWQNWVSDGQETGTDGKGLRVEALKVKLVNAPAGANVKYQAHVQSIGWQNWVSNGQEAGTEGKALRVEAIKITLENMPGYSIQYQAHVQSIGWQNWVSDGQEAGTDGKALRVEAIRIRIVPNTIHPISVSINKITDNLIVGNTDTLTSTVNPTDVANKTVAWISSNPAVATIDNTGKVTAVKAGIASITVTTEDGSKNATCIVTVSNPIIKVTSVSLNKTIDSLVVGDIDTLGVTVAPIDATNKDVTWISSNPAIATVDSAGKINAVSSGMVTITATTVDGSRNATCIVMVSNPIIKVTSVSLNKTINSLVVGETDNLVVDISPIDATDKNIIWTSSDPTIVTVDNVGKVNAVSVGDATITATTVDGNKTATCTVTVNADPIVADYTYTIIDSKAQIEKYTGVGGIVAIPSTLAGFPVTSISKNAFYGCSSLTAINIPQGVVSIGENAFGSCQSLINIDVAGDNFNYSSINSMLFNKEGTILISCPAGLTTVSIPQGVISIGDVAFYSSGVTNISIPQEVTSIGMGAFSGCNGLTTINIPKGVTSIGNEALTSCKSLTDITVDVDNLNYTSINGMLFNKEAISLITCPGGLATVSIPQGVTSIGDNAFRYCNSLTTISIPKGITSIGESAFSGCTSLTSIEVDTDNLNYMSINGALFNKEGTILIACPGGLTTLSIPQGVTSIGDYAFIGGGVTNISIPQEVTSIGNWAFYGCSGLTTIDIPQRVTSIGFEAFTYCTGLDSIKFNSATTVIYDREDTIPNTTKIIGYASSTAKDYCINYGKIFQDNSIVEPNTISINKNTDNLIVGCSDNLISTITPSNATNQAVTWSSSDSSIATVDNTGKVTAVSTGIATITVTTTEASKTASCSVTVNNQDNTPPTVNTITINKKIVTGGDTLTVTVDAQDDISGIKYINIQYDTPAGNPSSKGTALYKNSNGTYSGDIPIGAYDALGLWQVRDIGLTDNADNTTVIYNKESYSNQANSMDLSSGDIQVAGTISDFTPPTVNSITVNKNISTGGDTLTVTVDAQDDISGIKYINIQYDTPAGNPSSKGTALYKNSNGTYSGDIPIGAYDALGLWKVRDIGLTDNADNTTYIYNKESYSNQPNNMDLNSGDIQVAGTISDFTPPTVNSITVNKNISTGGDTLTVTVDAQDDISGIKYINIQYDTPVGNPSSKGTALHENSNGTYSGDIPIGAYDALGLWKVRDIGLTDNADNTIYIYNKEVYSNQPNNTDLSGGDFQVGN